MCYYWHIDALAGNNVDTEVVFTTVIDELSVCSCSSSSGRVRGFNDLGTHRTGYWIGFWGIPDYLFEEYHIFPLFGGYKYRVRRFKGS